MKNALLWPYKYVDLMGGRTSSATSRFQSKPASWDWSIRYRWICDALEGEGYNIFKPADFKVDIDNAKEWSDEPADIIIYNHTDIAEIKSKGLPSDAKRIWFFKPTVPDGVTTTLDELGYGSYSSITYEKPPYERSSPKEVSVFYKNTVRDWIRYNASKWGENHLKQKEISHEDFYLIVGQCGGDSVVNRQDFGGYFEKLELIIKELLLVDKDREIVVKLHPYTNGPMHNPNECDLINPLTKKYESFSPRVKVYSDFSSIHSFLPKTRCAFIGNSGAGFEAMMHDVPIISFCQPEYHWVTYDLRKTCDIHKAIELDWFSATSQRKFLYWYMEKYCFYDYDSAKRRVDDLLEEEIEYRTIFL